MAIKVFLSDGENKHTVSRFVGNEYRYWRFIRFDFDSQVELIVEYNDE